MDLENVKLIIEKNSSEAVKLFIKQTENVFSFTELDAIDNSREKLWQNLYNLANSYILNEQERANCFSAIRILSRDKKSLNNLITQNDWLNLIRKVSGLDDFNHQFTEENKIVAIEAEKCLCNFVFNSLNVANECCKNGILFRINDRIALYKEESFPYELKFFDMKLMFIITALCSNIRKVLRDEKYAVDHLIEHLNNIINKNPNNIDTNDLDLTSEILKALFNLTLHLESNEEVIKKYSNLVNILRKFLLIPVNCEDKRNILHNNVINLLTNMPSECYKQLIPPIDISKPILMEYKGFNVDCLKIILKLLAVKLENNVKISEQLEIISPTATVLYNAANADKIMRKYLRSEILPPLKDVHNRPEEGTTIRNYLCRLLTSPMTQLRDIIAEFLFILCKKSVKRMIKYTGYGNAAGLLARKGLLGGKEDNEAADFSSDSESSETEEYAELKHMINPVLGCYEVPHQDPMKDMTDEQKEYEALKLVQLMNDLTNSGTIKPCRVGADGKPEPIEHVLQLQENIKFKNIDDDDSD